MKTKNLVLNAAFALLISAAVVYADSPGPFDASCALQEAAKGDGRKVDERVKFMTLCERSEVVILAREERRAGRVVFTCTEVLKGGNSLPNVGEALEFPVGTSKFESQPKEAVLFLPRFPSGGSFRSTRLVDGKYHGVLTTDDLKNVLRAPKS